jgi:hypothetical protein
MEKRPQATRFPVSLALGTMFSAVLLLASCGSALEGVSTPTNTAGRPLSSSADFPQPPITGTITLPAIPSARSSPTTGSSAESTSGSPTTLASQSPSWQQEGSRLIAQETAQPSKGVVSPLPNAPSWAFESEPTTISADGSYTLMFDVPSDFTITQLGQQPFEYAIEYPPDVRDHFEASPAGPPSLVNLSGSTYFEVPINVTSFSSTYSGLQVWVY